MKRILQLSIALMLTLVNQATATPPPLEREARAAWIATVDNIDWPSKAGLPVEQQKAELIAMLDRAVALKLNIIILQVRPGCDALYKSKLEPWSEYFTGTMGVAPSPFYDPLQFAIEEAHKRGLELHAWFNPFRARYNNTRGDASANHISHTKPEWVKTYGKWLWLDPGEKEVREYSIKVFLDVVKRYDVDGVHMDDYFYPYQVRDAAKKLVDFPDQPSWDRYVAAGGKLTRADWRRENINQFMEELYRSVKKEKPWVRSGVSPFGIWRPGYPKGIVGLDAYSSLYADARKWLSQGSLDYFVPQLYWSIKAEKQSYPALLRWWSEQNTHGRHLWPGNSAYRTGKPEGVEEILNQVRVTREQPGASGNVFWSMKVLRNPWADRLAQQYYPTPALVPAADWLSQTAPKEPRLKTKSTSHELRLDWSARDRQPIHLWALQKRTGSQWTVEILPGTQKSLRLTNSSSAQWPEEIALTAVNRFGQSSPAAVSLIPARK